MRQRWASLASRPSVMRPALLLFLTLITMPLCGEAAEPLHQDAIMQLLKSRTGEIRSSSGSVRIVTWNADNSLCLRLSRTDAGCFDTGRWQVENGRVCYEFSRYGANVGLNKGCFRVVSTSGGGYEELGDHGTQGGKITIVE